MKKILVTGAKGMLGQDLCQILKKSNFNVIATDKNDFDVTKIDQVNQILKKEKPDFVIHCAAYTNVDEAEKNIEIARLINSKSTEYIAKACVNIKATLIYISTDYVFDGNKNTVYKTSDKANPINNYGLTKFEGEQAVCKFCNKYYIIRTSWLYGIHGKNFVETMISLADKKELHVVDDQIGCPTWTVDLCYAIVDLLNKKPFGIYHICGSGATSWYNFAKKIFEFSDLKTNLKPCKTKDYPRIAKRPKYSVLDNENCCRNWELALKDYLKTKNH